jgi:methionine-rich copper-binding protein CopC
MRATFKAASALLLAVAILSGWTVRHLDLKASFPEADAALAQAPAEIWLEFSVAPDMARTSFSVRGPAGNVELGPVTAGAKPEIIKAAVKGATPPGSYTVSWAGAPPNDHVVRGRFTFTVAARR